MRFTRFVAAVFVTGLIIAASHPARAQEARPVRLLAVSPAGGPGDFVARLIAPYLGEGLNRHVVVDNRPSVNGILASEICAKAAPDGTTLIVGNNGTHAINPHLYRKLPYDPVRDFTPITQLVFSPSVLVGSPKIAPKTFNELVAAARKEPDKFNIGVPGANAQASVELLKSVMAIKLNNIPFKGSAPTEVAVMSGEVDIAFLSLPSAAAHLKNNRIKAFATSVAKRSALIPEVPTFDELGVKNFRVGQWHGLLGPAKLPVAYVRRAHAAMARMFEQPQVKEALASRGSEIMLDTPEEFAQVIRSDLARFGKILREAKVEMQ